MIKVLTLKTFVVSRRWYNNTMILFDGYRFAADAELLVAREVQRLAERDVTPTIAAILFQEDVGSQLYTRLKQEAATRVGIGYQVHTFSMTDDPAAAITKIQELNVNPAITGIIIQKPWRSTWLNLHSENGDFTLWWQGLVTQLDPEKDVDGLHPSTLAAIKNDSWRADGKVLPATAKAVLDILRAANEELKIISGSGLSPEATYTIIGKSDILGQPLYYELLNQGVDVEMLGQKELTAKIEQGIALTDRDVIISATGRTKLITGPMIKPGAVVIDVGEPKPDIDAETVTGKASFLTPVPGGVGPVTVVSLLGNAVSLAI